MRSAEELIGSLEYLSVLEEHEDSGALIFEFVWDHLEIKDLEQINKMLELAVAADISEYEIHTMLAATQDYLECLPARDMLTKYLKE